MAIREYKLEEIKGYHFIPNKWQKTNLIQTVPNFGKDEGKWEF